MADWQTVDTRELDELIRKFGGLPAHLREEVVDAGLESGGNIIREYMRGSLIEKGLVDTGQLIDSLKAKRVSPTAVEVRPTGNRHRNTAAAPVRKYRKYTPVLRIGRSRYRFDAVRNAEVAFILEYGSSDEEHVDARKSKGRKAYHWMSEAAEASEQDIEDMMTELVAKAFEKL